LFVVADDELHLGVFARRDDAPGRLLRLLAGDLPDAPDKRKKRKSDFEALVMLPPFGPYSRGALLALGSGSGEKKPRSQGVLLALDAAGRPDSSPPRLLDLGEFHAQLRNEVEDLNLEGAVVCGAEFVLFQRGNKGKGCNATLHLPLAKWLAALAAADHAPRTRVTAVKRHTLGEQDGVPLCFTDAAALPDGTLLFSAVAENTADSVNDGPCRAAAIGRLDPRTQALELRRLARPWKIEGLHAWRDADAIAFLAVTDADDPSAAAVLLSGRYPD
ncbi:unnamed protein product, partial [Phaeothamnion confervicola]